MKSEEDEAFDELAKRQGAWGGGFKAKQAMAADKQHWNEDEWRRNNWRCGHGWLRGEQCEICNAAQPAQEPVAWQTMEAKYPSLEKLDIRMGDGSILCNVWPQSDGDLWWEGSGTGEKFIDPKYANVTHWRIHAEHTAPPQREWVGLTDGEAGECHSPNYVQTVARIEAKLKEKNT